MLLSYILQCLNLCSQKLSTHTSKSQTGYNYFDFSQCLFFFNLIGLKYRLTFTVSIPSTARGKGEPRMSFTCQSDSKV